MITIVLMEPENPGNLGAVARVMKNFGFENLILVNPKIDHLCSEAKNRAKHAQDVLQEAKVVQIDYLKRFDCLVATTAKLGSEYHIARSPLTPEQMAKKISGNSAILFGREGIGLTNEEIARCDFVVNIPASKYNSLNVSHAVAVILYELSKQEDPRQVQLMSAKEKRILLKRIDETIDSLPFSSAEKKATQRITWKRLIGKAMVTKREFFVIMGFLGKISHRQQSRRQ